MCGKKYEEEISDFEIAKEMKFTGKMIINIHCTTELNKNDE